MSYDLRTKVAIEMRAEMGRIDNIPTRPWHDAAERNKLIWRQLADVAIKVVQEEEKIDG